MDMPNTNLPTFNGIRILDEPIEKVLSLIKERTLPGFSYIVTPNADHFCRLADKKNSAFIEAYKEADVRICDSRIIRKLSFLEKQPIRNVTPGSDLTRKILESSWAKNIDMLLIGPEPHEVEHIKKEYSLPQLKHYTPPMGFIKNEAEVLKCINIINSSNAALVFLAVGSPQQELLAYRVKKSSQETSPKKIVMLCIGASFDFLSGKTTRAPQVIQRLHLEWLHRALSDPKRLIPRYWKNFLWILSYIFKNKI